MMPTAPLRVGPNRRARLCQLPGSVSGALRRDAAQQRPRRGEDEAAVVDGGELEAALAVGTVLVADVAADQGAGEVRGDHDDAPLAGQRVVVGERGAAHARAGSAPSPTPNAPTRLELRASAS